MSERTIVITGASDGIGAAAARKLADAGAKVVVVGRSAAKTEAVAHGIAADFLVADFTRLDEVRALASELGSRYPHIDVLANNAGGLFKGGEVTVDGFEKTMQVNHLAPFLLTNLLLDTLKRSRSTVINTSSAAARQGHIDLADLAQQKGASSFQAYGNSKLANVLFTFGLHRRFHEEGISAAVFHPGVVATNFASTAVGAARWMYQSPLSRLLITPGRGAATLVWLAEGTPGLDWQPGGYFEKKRPATTNKQAYDAGLIEQFWVRSAELVGI